MAAAEPTDGAPEDMTTLSMDELRAIMRIDTNRAIAVSEVPPGGVVNVVMGFGVNAKSLGRAIGGYRLEPDPVKVARRDAARAEAKKRGDAAVRAFLEDLNATVMYGEGTFYEKSTDTLVRVQGDTTLHVTVNNDYDIFESFTVYLYVGEEELSSAHTSSRYLCANHARLLLSYMEERAQGEAPDEA